MMALLLVGAGAVMILIGSTDVLVDFTKSAGKVVNPPGYPDIAFFPYAVAALIVSLPLVFPSEGDTSWQKVYIGLILLTALVANEPGVSKSIEDITNILNNKKVG